MNAQRRHHPPRSLLGWIVLSVIALLIVACGAGGGRDRLDVSPSEDEEQLAVSPTTEPADSTEASRQEAVEEPPRIVQHEQGVSEVPALPERVVTLDGLHLDATLALGVTPVGAVAVEDDQLPIHLDRYTSGVEVVGTTQEPDLDAVAALEPDLILSAAFHHEELYEQLSEIAPTVSTVSSGSEWEDGFRLVAEALGREDDVARLLTAYHERVAQLAAEVGAEELTASIVRFLPDETRLYGPATFSGSVLVDVGFELTDVAYGTSPTYRLRKGPAELAEADVLFSSISPALDPNRETEIATRLGELDGVGPGCRFEVDGQVWMGAGGIIGAEMILADVEELLGGAECAAGSA